MTGMAGQGCPALSFWQTEPGSMSHPGFAGMKTGWRRNRSVSVYIGHRMRWISRIRCSRSTKPPHGLSKPYPMTARSVGGRRRIQLVTPILWIPAFPRMPDAESKTENHAAWYSKQKNSRVARILGAHLPIRFSDTPSFLSQSLLIRPGL